MTGLSRRHFLSRSTLAMAVGLAAVPGLSGALRLVRPAPAVSGAEPLIVHVSNLAEGEMSLLVGTEQRIVHDHDLAFRLYAAARPNR